MYRDRLELHCWDAAPKSEDVLPLNRLRIFVSISQAIRIPLLVALKDARKTKEFFRNHPFLVGGQGL